LRNANIRVFSAKKNVAIDFLFATRTAKGNYLSISKGTVVCSNKLRLTDRWRRVLSNP